MRLRVWLCVDVSLAHNSLRVVGGVAIAGALPRLSSLTTLKYVGSEGGEWCDCDAMGTRDVCMSGSERYSSTVSWAL